MAAIQTYREYIDMEITSSSSNSSSDFYCNYSINCSPTRKTRQFEFQMDSKSPNENKAKILPLHLLEKTKMESSYNNIILPSESRRHSQDDYFFEWSIELDDDSDHFDDSKKHSWAKKVNKVKKLSIISQKLKASREYFKLLFNKSSCSNNVTCATTQVENVSSRKISRSKRRSSSSSISSSGSSSFSLSSSLSGFQDIQSLKRRIGLNSENENSIEGAIAHCKQSRLISRTCSYSASSRTFGDYQRSELCYIY